MFSSNIINREIKSVEKLDELSLYLEICKYKKKLEGLKYTALVTPNSSNDAFIQTELSAIKYKIKIHERQLKKFGIDIQDKKQLHTWKSACQNYLNQLSVLEYTILLQTRMSGQSLNMFCPTEEGQSFFLNTNQPNDIQEKVMAMKIS